MSAVCVAFLAACSADYETDFTRWSLEVSHQDQATIVFEKEGGSKDIPVTTNLKDDEWTATSNADWCKVTKSGNTVTVSGDAYNGYRTRNAVVTIAYGHQSYEINVQQLGLEGNLTLPEEGGFYNRRQNTYAYVSFDQENLNVPAVTNMDIDHVIVPDTVDWVTFDESQDIKQDANGRTNIKLGLKQNRTNDRRYCTVLLQSSENWDLTKSFVIIQAPFEYLVYPVYGNTEITLDHLANKVIVPFQHPIIDAGYNTTGGDDADWLSVGGASNATDEITLDAKANDNTSARSTLLTLTGASDASKTFSVKVNQEGYKVQAPKNVWEPKATPGKGRITVTWDPAGRIDYDKVEIVMTNARLNQTVTKTINSVKTKSTTFEPTYKFAGDYQFTIRTYNKEGVVTETPITITGQSNEWSEDKEVDLSVDMLSSNSIADGHGLKLLVDGKAATYFQTGGSDASERHYVQIALPSAITGEFYFNFTGRTGNVSSDPVTVEVYGSNTGTGASSTWEDLGTITYPRPSRPGGVREAQNHLTTTGNWKYLRFVPTERRNLVLADGSAKYYWAAAELMLYVHHDEAWAEKNIK